MYKYIVLLLLIFIGQAQAGVLYEQTRGGHAYDITADGGAGYGMYSVFPFWSGSGPLFPGSGGLVLASDIRFLRLTRTSGVPCSQPLRLLLAADDGSNVVQETVAGIEVGTYCDYPLSGASAGMRFWSLFICLNNGCDASSGSLVLDGSPDNPGYLVDGTQTISQSGGWAFQLCDIDGCSDFARKTPTGFYWPTGTNALSNYAEWLALGCNGSTDYLTDRYHIGKDIAATKGDSVYAIASGKIIARSVNGWGSQNVALVIRHALANGIEFFALYGHVRSALDVGATVTAGEAIATVGPWVYGPHLHFGIHLGPTFPENRFGIMPCSAWPKTNGFVEPVSWITTQTPGTLSQ